MSTEPAAQIGAETRAGSFDQKLIDRRTFRRLDRGLAPVEVALMRWGEWVRRTQANRVPNAPRSSSFMHSVMKGTTLVQTDPNAPEPPIPVAIAMVDVAVARLPPRVMEAVDVRYVNGPELPEAQARRLNISLSALKVRLMIARTAVAVFLGIVQED